MHLQTAAENAQHLVARLGPPNTRLNKRAAKLSVSLARVAGKTTLIDELVLRFLQHQPKTRVQYYRTIRA